MNTNSLFASRCFALMTALLAVILLGVLVTSCGIYFGTGAPSSPPPQSSSDTSSSSSQGQGSSNGGSPMIVTTSDQPCPSTDFSLKQGIATCNFPGGKLLICEGDINDSLGVRHDTDPTTGQVDEIDQAATIDGRDNGGTCHYSPPWTEDMSINSVKNGCGGGCAKVLVYRDGQLVKTV